jgi:hypothetical protein
VHSLAREAEPPLEDVVVWEELEREVVRRRDVLRVAGERRPPERSAPLAKERADVLGNEPRNLERVLDAGLQRLASNVFP